MSEFKYSHLFEPIVLGNQLFRNRIFNSPTGVEIDPERYSCAYYERKAIGGSASVCIGDACPNEFGRVRPSQINLWNNNDRATIIIAFLHVRYETVVGTIVTTAFVHWLKGALITSFSHNFNTKNSDTFCEKRVDTTILCEIIKG